MLVIAIYVYCGPFNLGSRLGSLHSTGSVYTCGFRWLLVGNTHSILQLGWKAPAGALARCRSSMKTYLGHDSGNWAAKEDHKFDDIYSYFMLRADFTHRSLAVKHLALIMFSQRNSASCQSWLAVSALPPASNLFRIQNRNRDLIYRCYGDTQVCHFEKQHRAKCRPGLDLLRQIVLILPCVSTLSLLVQFLQYNGSALCARHNCTHPDRRRVNSRSTGSWILSISYLPVQGVSIEKTGRLLGDGTIKNAKTI